MPDAKLLLSWRERKAVFRGAQWFLNEADHNEQAAAFADDLCEKLDDGGVWNPCFLIVNDADEIATSNAAYSFRLILNSSMQSLPDHEHELRMVKDRYVYTDDRSVQKTKHNKPPFLTKRDYYGPNWRAVREKAIQRDGGECSRCGTTRREHRNKHDHDLHVHHITPLRQIGDYSKANKLENLRTLCFRCHKLVEQ